MGRDAAAVEAGEQGGPELFAGELLGLDQQPGLRRAREDARPGLDHVVVDLGEVVEAPEGGVAVGGARQGGDGGGVVRRREAEAAVGQAPDLLGEVVLLVGR